MNAPLISLKKLRRTYKSGDETIAALNDIDLDIAPGEMIAIIGASGSGKSTLMNVLGCLDHGWSGSYTFAGREILKLGSEELAALRREHFGFIFQRYQLLGDLNAIENVEVPAIYAGVRPAARRARARQLLERLGLGERMDHRPNALSGGQQQRVSIARALMNGGKVILADEPTGALDTKSGAEMMDLLRELNEQGHTIIIVTHEHEVAEYAERVIEIRDGQIVSDTRARKAPDRSQDFEEPRLKRQTSLFDTLSRSLQAFMIARRAMAGRKLRTFLTMLGIIIGIASVVSVVALGQGSQEQVLNNIRAIGTNTINVFSGQGFANRNAARVETLVPADAEAIAQLPAVDSATPRVNSSSAGLYGNVSGTISLNGVGDQYFRVSGTDIVEGVGFDNISVETLAQEAVIDQNTRDTFFPNGEDPLGEVILIGRLPVRVIGVTAASSSPFGASNSLNVYVPYTTAMTRVLGQSFLNSLVVRVKDDADMSEAESQIDALMLQRHGTKDFTLLNTDTIRSTIESTTQTLTLFISMIALISLFVGGIGVMNIMLVSVTERTREIGVRIAVGARRSDILRQFLIEAVLVCLIGGSVGVALSVGIASLVTAFFPSFSMPLSPTMILAAFVSSTMIGIIFGFVPARSAARLDPIEALARE